MQGWCPKYEFLLIKIHYWQDVSDVLPLQTTLIRVGTCATLGNILN
jgi:hypothetical protein